MRSRTGATLLLIGTFVLGGVTGAVSFSLYRTHLAPQTKKAGDRRPPGPRDIAGEMAQALNLDAAQKEKLERIFSESRERYRALSSQFRPQYETIRKETDEQIRQILREDQKERFEQFIKEMDSRRKNPGAHRPR